LKADTLTLKALFQRDVRYVIPTFQRPYVWNQEEQWEPLWDDLRNTAERYLDELDRAEGDMPRAEENTGSHFLGAVVLQQRPTASAQIDTRQVIDGQQRLTTMQLLIDAAQEALEELGADEAERLSRLVLNDHAAGDDVFKLWPTSLDRDAFRAAMTNGLSPEEFESSPIVQAHDFFRLQIREWIDQVADAKEQSGRIHALETTLFGLMEMVVIDLATADDAFVIFETLNARGTPLLASDLVKNYVLQSATAEHLSSDELYERDWKPLEDKWWRDEVRQGRIVRPRIDVFLNYWLIMRTGNEIASPDVFPAFKSYVEANNKSVANVAHDLRRVGSIYRNFDGFDPWTIEGTFFYRWRTIDAGVTTPVLLWLFDQKGELETQRLERALSALESFLVRRMLCRMTTAGYNNLFLELISRLGKEDPTQADDILITYLAEQTAESRFWPDDQKFIGDLLDLPLYRLLTRGRLRMVLETLEDDLRTPKTEQEHVARGTLTIEHILPQTWIDHWPLPADVDQVEASLDRNRLLHSLGNLTLVNNKLNPSLSNCAWRTKAGALADYSILHLNKNLLSSFTEKDWNEAAIRERGESLAEAAARIWPQAAAFTTAP
jgi:hypothetical protein